MVRNLRSILFLCFLTQCTKPEITPEMDRFVQQFDGLTMASIKDRVQQGLLEFSKVDSFLPKSNEQFKKNTARIDEKYTRQFSIDTTSVSRALLQYDALFFDQQFVHYESVLTFAKKDMRFWKPIRLPELMKEELLSHTIYYRDEPKLTTKKGYEVNFSAGSSWGTLGVIDSVEVQYSLSYPSKVDSLFLDLNQPIVFYNGEKIELVEKENNCIQLSVPKKLNKSLMVMGFTKEGRALEVQAQTNSVRSPEMQKEAVKQMHRFFEGLQRRLDENSLKDTAACKEYIRSHMTDLTWLRTPKNEHKTICFRGNVSRVGLYFIADTTLKRSNFIAKRGNKFGEVIHMPTALGNEFLSKDLTSLFTIDSLKIRSLGERYFIGNDHYYYLDILTQALVVIEADDLKEFSNGLAVVKGKNKETYSLRNAQNSTISGKNIVRFEELSPQLVAVYDEENRLYLVNAAGSIKVLSQVKLINSLRDGRMLVQDVNGWYGFLDEKGALVIPFDFGSAMDFSEGMAAVKKEGGLYGFIDNNGKHVLPYAYTRASNFIEGVAFVSTIDSLFLINRHGEPMLKAPMQSWGISGFGTSRVYQFGDAYYDVHGKKTIKPD